MNNYDIIAELASTASNQKGEIEQLQRDVASQKVTIEMLEHKETLTRNNIAGLSRFFRAHDLTYLDSDSSIHKTFQAVKKKITDQAEEITKLIQTAQKLEEATDEPNNTLP